MNTCVPVRHSHDHTVHSALTGLVDDGLQGWNERFATFQTETFLWRPLSLEKVLKPANRWWCCCFTLWLRTHRLSISVLFQLITDVGSVQQSQRNQDKPGGADHPGQQSPLLLQTEVHDSWCLKLLSDPLALLHVINEHKLYSNMLTVGHLQEREGRSVCVDWQTELNLKCLLYSNVHSDREEEEHRLLKTDANNAGLKILKKKSAF